ncbi:MAG TPA: RNA polymerase sigma factor [Polyangiaceae bacterium]|nr:RNA polymerase sigma factor [Polyangiaceae bacterium]
MQATLALQPSFSTGVGNRSRDFRLALDEELVARVQAGDMLAFRELFRLHKNNVARLVQRMTGRRSDVDDLIQEVFLQVHRSIGRFHGKSRFSTWLYRVTVNVVLMHRRAARSRPTLVEQPETMVPEDREPLPDEQAARAARVRVFATLLEELSEKKRVVFILHELEGMAAAEIAEVVEAPVLTVRTRLFYARRELEALIRKEPALASVLAELEAGKRQVAEAGQ